MSFVVLQTGGDLILVEVFLFVITACAGYIAWRARQMYNQLDSLTEQVQMNSMHLVGQEGTPYDGIVPKVTENRNQIKDNHNLIQRIQRSLEREGIIAEDSYSTHLRWGGNAATDGGEEEHEPKPDR